MRYERAGGEREVGTDTESDGERESEGDMRMCVDTEGDATESDVNHAVGTRNDGDQRSQQDSRTHPPRCRPREHTAKQR